MKPWIAHSIQLLQDSLGAPRQELNELDWKSGLSPDRRRLTEHLSAFGNQSGGGVLVFGIANDGVPVGIAQEDVDRIVNQLANLGRDSVEPPLVIDHAIEPWQNVSLLLIRINESAEKPVHLRGQSMDQAWIRSGGTTRRASRQELGTLLLHSRTPRWEELFAGTLRSDEDLLMALQPHPVLEMLKRPAPSDPAAMLSWMAEEGWIARDPRGGGHITNLGAITAARDLTEFPDLSRKAVRVIVYEGTDKTRSKPEREGKMGYALGFQGILAHVEKQVSHEDYLKGLRITVQPYPSIALREIIANALIHQDFTVSGSGPMVEIFTDRIAITNPGGLLPSKRLERLIGTQPESRNERFARACRRYGICEERGSGLIKAGQAVETAGLPPIHFAATEGHITVTLFAPRAFAGMTMQERLEAVYQHAQLQHLSGKVMTNATLRDRLRVSDKQRRTVTSLIQTALERNLIKSADPDSSSRKFAEYLPHWA